MKLRSKCNHGFTNRGCLHCAILKAYEARDMHFFLQNMQNEILKMFENNMKFTRAACWINSKIIIRDKNTHSWYSYFVTIVGHYYGVIIDVV